MDKNILYLECYSGISGDTTVAALLDLGADPDVLTAGLKSLPVDGYQVIIGRKIKMGIDACDFTVLLEGEDVLNKPQWDNQKMYDQRHTHAYSYKDNPHGGHLHRNLYDINAIIEQSGITDNAKSIAKQIFYIIAVAESQAHGKPLEEVHFHEVGALDSIVDIVSTAICLDNLKIQEVIVSEMYEGTGRVECQHGSLPIPVPAVVNIAAGYHLPLHITSVKGEMITPTGAAIVAAIRTMDTLPEKFRIRKIGLGAGKREFPHANILRAMLIEEDISDLPKENTEKVWILEANIDDCSGEALSAATDILFQNGAKDVYYTPIYMKKNRPAYLLGVICAKKEREQLEEIIFTHTSTIGIRKHEVSRTILERKQMTVSTPYGDALVKVCTYHNKQFFYPEYESIKALCMETGQDYITLYSIVQSLACQ